MSFFQLDNLRRARRHGQPWHLIVHEDVLIFRNPPNLGSSRELKGRGRQYEFEGVPRQVSRVGSGVAEELRVVA